VLDDPRRPKLRHPGRPWRLIAQELSAETNPERLTELSRELAGAIDDQQLGNKWQGEAATSDPHPTIARQQSEYEKIVDDAVALMRSDYASVQMLFPERGSGGELLLLAFRGFNPEAAKFWKWVRADSKSTCGIALRDEQRVVAPDIAACDFMADSDDQQVYLQTGILACQTTPLIGQAGNVVGMISTHWRNPFTPSEKDFRLFDALARQAAGLIEACRREGDLP
jgi:GAF domain-containing protein